MSPKKPVDAATRYKKEKGEDFESRDYYKIQSLVGKPHVYFHMSDIGPRMTKTRYDADGVNIDKPLTNTNETRFSINPRTKYRTPAGIYAYPLNEEMYGRLLTNDLPFKTGSPWVYLFEVNASYHDKVLDIDSYGKEQYRADIAKLAKLVSRMEFRKHSGAIFDAKDIGNKWASRIWNFTRLLSEKDAAEWSKLLTALGYVGAVDPSLGLIHQKEPEQAVFFAQAVVPLKTKGVLRLVDVLSTRELRYKRIDRKQRHLITHVNMIPDRELRKYMNLENPYTRADVASRLPVKLLPKMMHDRAPMVVIEVAKRIAPKYLDEIAERVSKYPSTQAALALAAIVKRFDPKKAWQLYRKHEELVQSNAALRRAVVSRLPPERLTMFTQDGDSGVRILVSQRLPEDQLPDMLADPSFSVRATVAERIDVRYLPEMVKTERNDEVLTEIIKRLPIEYIYKYRKELRDDVQSGIHSYSVQDLLDARIKEHEATQKKQEKAAGVNSLEPAPTTARVQFTKLARTTGILKQAGRDDLAAFHSEVQRTAAQDGRQKLASAVADLMVLEASAEPGEAQRYEAAISRMLDDLVDFDSILEPAAPELPKDITDLSDTLTPEEVNLEMELTEELDPDWFDSVVSILAPGEPEQKEAASGRE